MALSQEQQTVSLMTRICYDPCETLYDNSNKMSRLCKSKSVTCEKRELPFRCSTVKSRNFTCVFTIQGSALCRGDAFCRSPTRGKERKKKEKTQITNVKDRMYKGEEERRTRSFLIQQKHNLFHCTCTKQEESSKNTTKPMFAASAREELSKYKRTSLASDGPRPDPLVHREVDIIVDRQRVGTVNKAKDLSTDECGANVTLTQHVKGGVNGRRCVSRAKANVGIIPNLQEAQSTASSRSNKSNFITRRKVSTSVRSNSSSGDSNSSSSSSSSSGSSGSSSSSSSSSSRFLVEIHKRLKNRQGEQRINKDPSFDFYAY
ncbi:hypothetical protein V1477_017175 [Vespula maculifrons]|uniref:Uncharacterized protein n=1 Tax=Vespula maculifrons TaxID=7453 RepID=A0ABD2B5A5_VESMC